MQCLGRNGLLYWDSYQSCIDLKIGAGISTVLTAEAVATGEINCYHFKCHTQGVVDTTSQGCSSAAQRPVAYYDAITDTRATKLPITAHITCFRFGQKTVALSNIIRFKSRS